MKLKFIDNNAAWLELLDDGAEAFLTIACRDDDEDAERVFEVTDAHDLRVLHAALGILIGRLEKGGGA